RRSFRSTQHPRERSVPHLFQMGKRRRLRRGNLRLPLKMKKEEPMAAKLLPPVHPGEILREEFMRPLELSSNALARAIGVTPARVNDIASEKRGITADSA